MVLLPVLIDHLRPAFRSSCAAISQTYEGELGLVMSTRVDMRKYLPFRTLARSDVGCWINLQSCFANSARFKFLKSRKPSPPLSWGVHTLFQAIQCSPMLFCFVLHQKWEMALVSFLVISSGNRRHDIGWECLRHKLDKYLFPSFGEEFLGP